jgi:hypothetical protein
MKPKIIVTKHGLEVNGNQVQTLNRNHAKLEAAALAKIHGCSWYSLKKGGKLQEVKP